MDYHLKLDANRLQIFHEGRKRRILVAELIYDKEGDRYELTYNKKYVNSKNAIPIGPELSLFKLKHFSERGKLFPSFLDRIPDKSNPAYADYCKAQGISSLEKNPIILLGAIGRRGPSSFVFEPIYYSEFGPKDLAALRKKLNITQYDFAMAFDISKTMLQRLESGKSQDKNLLKNIQLLLSIPEAAIWQLKQTGSYVNRDVAEKLISYFQEKL